MKRLLSYILMFLFFCNLCLGTITITSNKVTYACGNSDTTFDFTFPIVGTSDLVVLLRTAATGAEEVLDLTDDYSISAVSNDLANGGTVTTVATYSEAYTITLLRNTPKTQQADLEDSGVLRLESLEDALDKLTLLAQQLQEQIDRSIKIPRSETLTTEIDDSVSRANKYLYFSAAGVPTVASDVNVITSGEATVSAYCESWLDATDEAALKAALNLEAGTDFVAPDIELTALYGLTSAANKLPYFTGSGTASVTTLSAFGRTIIDDADGAAVFTTLGMLDEDTMSSNSASYPPSQQSVKAYVDSQSTGKIAQIVNTVVTAMSTTAVAIPTDTSIPQITEGAQFMSLAITPTSATNKLKIDVVFVGCCNNSRDAVVALFQDSTANALAAVIEYMDNNGEGYTVAFSYVMTAGTTSETTFRVRAGMDDTSTLTFNGAAGAALLGGVMASSITITEYETGV